MDGRGGVVVVASAAVSCFRKKDTQDEHFRGRVERHDAALDRLIEAGRAGDDTATVYQLHGAGNITVGVHFRFGVFRRTLRPALLNRHANGCNGDAGQAGPGSALRRTL